VINLLEHIVPSDFSDKIRLYDYIGQYFKSHIPSRKGLKKAISRGAILIDDQKASSGDWIKANQVITLLDLELNPPKAFPMKLEVVFEDDYLAIINKPAGISVSGNQYRTIQNALVDQIKLSTQIDALKWARPVHRLDNPTSGLLLIAKTATTLIALGNMFKDKSIEKRYEAIVIGSVAENGIVSAEIEGKSAVTHYEVMLEVKSLKNDTLTHLGLSPKTGRTHQIRIHLSGIGHAIMGDQQYGIEGQVYTEKGLFLAAVGLSFVHPNTCAPFEVKIPTPHKFTSLMEREQRRWNKYN
jgi:RluA family pseudouridine synthase